MALVMLPCDLPWWTSVQRHLKHLLLASSSDKLVAGMLKVHDMCNIGLDPDEDSKDPELLKGLAAFLEDEVSAEERRRFMDNTLRVMVTRALQLRRWKPAKGLVFSLQQQSDVTELDYNFVSSLIAHSFFSTFPKRTLKTHPTLQDFNFTHFFKNLHRKSQRSKLKSLLHYFEWLDQNKAEGSIKITRKVMTAKQWLTIEDWLECSLPLCRLLVRHEGRPERCEMDDAIRVCFASSRLGGDALLDGESQESLWMFMMPELLATLLSVEALEDNEVVTVEGVRVFSRIHDGRHQDPLETLAQPKEVTVCMMDAENYRQLPLSQWEEDNVLRELNKCLLAFQQAPSPPPPTRDTPRAHERRLSPIGESFSHTPPEVEATVMIKQSSCSTVNSYHSRSPTPDAYCAATLNLNDPSIEITKRKCWLSPDGNTLNNRRGRFIVLGSSGECLPVSRGDGGGGGGGGAAQEDSLYSSCNSSDDEFHSANGSFDEGSEDEGRGASGRPSCFHYTKELSTEARRLSFATRLRDALRREADLSCTTSSSGDWSSDSSSYAVGISISGAELNDNDIRVKRGGSVGFVLTDKENAVSNGTRSPPRRCPALRRDTGNSSKYSFSTEYSSELEEVYEQFSQWLDDPIVDAESGEHRPRELDSRDLAVIRFAGSLLKRTLSESFAGMPLTEGCAHAAGTEPAGRAPSAAEAARAPERSARHKLALTARSLSLELAKHKHRLAAQLKSKQSNCIPEENESSNERQSRREAIVKSGESDSTEDVGEPGGEPGEEPGGEPGEEPGEEPDGEPERRRSSSAETGSTVVLATAPPRNSKMRKRKLNWIISIVAEVIEECEPVILKIRKSQLSQLAQKIVGGGACRPVATGNWGCGRRQKGHPQLKLMLQWLAASVAGVPALLYYTAGNDKLFKLDTVVRVLVDRKWSVGQLTRALLRFARRALHEPAGASPRADLFEELIGIDRAPDDL